MGAYIDTKKASVSLEIFKKTVGYIGSGSVEYVKDAMPVTTSTIADARMISSEVKSSLTGMMNDQIIPTIKSLKISGGFKGITNWFLEKEDEFDYDGAFSSGGLSFDDGTEIAGAEIAGAEIAEAQLGNDDRNTNKIAKAVVESSHQMVEAQISAVANVNASIAKQTAVISAGFDKTNQTLGKILDVLTKNTAAIIETNAAQAKYITSRKETSPNDQMLLSSRFNLNNYRNHIKKNFDESEASLVTSFASMLLDPNNVKTFLSPGNLIKVALGGAVNKAAPNLKKNMEALDDAVNDTIMSSLIRLGEGGKWGPNAFSKMFGLDSTKKEVDKSRSNLELKNVGYNTLAQEYITSAIPGYLRKILVAVGGDDEIYDPRSRSFKTKAKLHQEYRDFSSMRGTLGGASSRVRQAFSGGSDTTRMLYDLMMNDLSSKTGTGGKPEELRAILGNFSDNPQATASYLRSLMGSSYSKNDRRAINHFAKALMSLDRGYGIQDIKNQAARQAVNQNMRKDKYFRTADDYGMDLTDIEDSTALDRQNIIKNYRGGGPSIADSGKSPVVAALSGTQYTNTALYEIYRKLNKGINVYQVGQDSSRDKPFADFKNKYLARPFSYKEKHIADNMGFKNRNASIAGDNHKYEDPLANPVDENGNPQELTRGEKFGKWGKARGGQLIHALISGDSNDVRNVFDDVLRDVGNIAGDGMKKGLSKINDSFGNVSGFLKNKMFGTDYSYQDVDASGNSVTKTVRSSHNGLFGFFTDELKRDWGKAKDKGKKWWSEVSGYFDYDGNDSEEKKIAVKRKKLIGASVGAFAGLGLLGGPIGVLAGGLAGSALSTSNFGEKLKHKLFGRDDKGKATGSLTKLFDKITRPIEFQIGKTINYVANGLKKHVLGPLSDVGFAIRKRIMRGASSLMTKFLWNPIKKVGSTIGKGVAKGAGKLWEMGLGAAFGYKRAKWGAKSTIFGLGAEGLAHSIIGFDLKSQKELRERRKNRNANIAESNDRYSNMKHFNEIKDQEAAERQARWKNYKNIDEITTSVNELAKEGTKKGSIYVHDDGVHKYLKDIFEVISGRQSKNYYKEDEPINSVKRPANQNASIKGMNNSSGNNYANTALQTATVMGMSGDTLEGTELTLLSEIEKETRKDDPNDNTISSKLRRMMTIQKGKKEGAGSENESFVSKLFNGLGSIIGNLGNILKVGLGLYLIFKDLNTENGFIKRTFKGIQDIKEHLAGADGGGIFKGITHAAAGANLFTSPLDAKVDHLMDWVTPFASIDHLDTTGSGESITNQAMTGLKDKFLFEGGLQSFIRGDSHSFASSIAAGRGWLAQQAGKHYTKKLAKLQSKPFLGPVGQMKYNKYYKKANQQQEIVNNMAKQIDAPESSVGGHFVKMFKEGFGISAASGIASLGSKGVSYGIARLAGQDKENASRISDQTSRIAGTGTSGVLTSQAIYANSKGKASWAVKVTDSITKLFKAIPKLISDKCPKLAPYVSKISSLLDDMLRKVLSKVSSYMDDILAKIGISGGKEAAGAGTAFILPLVVAMYSYLSGTFDVEHLFFVLPDQNDDRMMTIAKILKAVFEALQWVPGVGIAFSIIDIIDMILQSIPATGGKGLTNWLAEICYKYLDLPSNWEANKQRLAELQGDFTKSKEDYNTKHDTDLSSAAYNDMINQNNGLFTNLLFGKTKVDKDGNPLTDEAGNPLTFGGLDDGILGNNKKYVKDASGNVIKGSDGKSIVAKDKYGNELKYDPKLFDYIGYGLHGMKRGLFGGDVYQTNEDGSTKYDANGNAIIDYHEKSFLGKLLEGNIKGAFFSDQVKEGYKEIQENGFWNSIEDSVNNIVMGSVENTLFNLTDKDRQSLFFDSLKFGTSASPLLSAFSPIINTIGGLSSESGNEQYELDENGNPLEYPTDANGKSLAEDGSKYVKKGDLAKYIGTGVKKANALILNPFLSLNDNSVTATDKNINTAAGNLIKLLGVTSTSPMLTLFSRAGGPDDSNLTPESYKSGGLGAKTEYPKEEGGNPLNKDFRITSKYGPREYPHKGEHKGVDLVPADGTKEADIGSRFNGTIIGVKSNIPDNLHAVNEGGNWVFHGTKDEATGNMVTIKTDDGKVIKNMHIKAGSIPSNIKVGSRVNVGDKLGVMGSTGWSTGPHLHYQIEDGSNQPIDPTASLSGKTISTFKSSSKTTYENTTDPDLGITSDTNGSASVAGLPTDTVEGSSETTGSGPLGTLLSALRTAGARMLSELTGGLLGAPTSDESSHGASNSGSNKHGGGGKSRYTTSPTSSGASSITTSPNSQWIDIVRKVKSAVANQQPIYYGEPGSFTVKLNVNGKQLSMRPDCSGLVGAMLKIYGAIPDDQNITSSALGSDNAIGKGFAKASFPGWDSLVEGDILVAPGSHTEIFANNDAGKHYVYNGGSTKSLRSPGATVSGHSSYTYIWRCQDVSSSIAGTNSNPLVAATVDGAKTGKEIALNASGKVDITDKKGLWDYLRNFYSEKAVSGIMAAWAEETDNRADRLEGDYILKPDFNATLASNDALDDYTVNRLFPMYDRNDIGIDQSAYKFGDHYYPGIGLAQWTGERGKKLLDFATSKGKDWRSYQTQLDFFKHEMDTKYDKNSEYNSVSTTPEAAAEWFARNYEGNTKSSYFEARKKRATEIYDQFATKNDDMPTDGAVGGDDSSFEYYNKYSSGSTIGNTSFKQSSRGGSSTKSQSSFVPKSNIFQFPTSGSSPQITAAGPSPIETQQATNTTEIVTMLYQVIKLLEGINSNTGESSKYLNTMSTLASPNKKVSGGSTPHSAPHRYQASNPNGNRMITSMVRP